MRAWLPSTTHSHFHLTYRLPTSSAIIVPTTSITTSMINTTSTVAGFTAAAAAAVVVGDDTLHPESEQRLIVDEYRLPGFLTRRYIYLQRHEKTRRWFKVT